MLVCTVLYSLIPRLLQGETGNEAIQHCTYQLCNLVASWVMPLDKRDHVCYSLQLHSIVNPDCSSLGLIKTSLMTKETSWHG